jgi:hypothetical protein
MSMIRRDSAGATGTSTVRFEAPSHLRGKKASVVGEFNGWDPSAHPLDGEGRATVVLPPGRYRFRYLTRCGQWFNDPAADAYERGHHGGMDGVLELPEPAGGSDGWRMPQAEAGTVQPLTA